MVTPSQVTPAQSNGHSTSKPSKKLPTPPVRALGRSGLTQFGGYIHEERIREFMGRRKADLIREMLDTDPDVGAMIFAITQLLRRVDKQIVPGSDLEEDEEADETAKFVTQCFDDMEMPWPEVMTEILSMLWWGWSWLEVVYKHRDGPDESAPSQRSKFSDGKVGWRGWYIRAQDTLLHWHFDDEDRMTGWVQTPPPNYSAIELPAERGLLFRTASQKGNPEGRSILQNAIRPYYYKKQIEQIEAIGVERDLAGLPVAYVPPDIMTSTAEEDVTFYRQIKDLVTNIRRDEQEGIIFPMAYDDQGHLMYELKLLSTGGSRQFDTDKIITRYSRQVVQTLLADFIKLGSEAVGSFALSSDKTSLFAVALGAWLDIIAAVINDQAIPELLRLNGIKTETPPKLVFGDIESRDVAQTVDAISKLTQAGMEIFPDPRVTKHLMDMLDLPTPSLEELEARAEQQRQQAEAMANLAVQGQAANVDHTVAKTDVALNPPTPKMAVGPDGKLPQPKPDPDGEKPDAKAKKASESQVYADDPLEDLLGPDWWDNADATDETVDEADPLATLLGQGWQDNPGLFDTSSNGGMA